MTETEDKFQVLSRGEFYKPGRWDKVNSAPTKIEAERQALRLVHEGSSPSAIVVEMRPVVVTRVLRDDNGVRMTYPQTIMGAEYQ